MDRSPTYPNLRRRLIYQTPVQWFARRTSGSIFGDPLLISTSSFDNWRAAAPGCRSEKLASNACPITTDVALFFRDFSTPGKNLRLRPGGFSFFDVAVAIVKQRQTCPTDLVVRPKR